MKKSILCVSLCWCGMAYGELIDHRSQSIVVHPQSTPPQEQPANQAEAASEIWLDQKRKHTKVWLNRTANKLDDWFGTPSPDKPASASLRVMFDLHNSKYDGTTIKPKLRGRLRLPALENRLSVMIGDDDLEHYDQIGWHINPDGTQKRFDRQKTQDDNSSLALRFSKWQSKHGIDTDADIGTRSGGEIYGRLRAEKRWQSEHQDTKLEQIYRYGTKSEHFLRTNYITTYQKSDTRSLTNHTYLEYTHDNDEKIAIGNTLYQTHTYPIPLGERRLSYGVNAYARVDENTYPNSYGAFVNYRQPIWRNWLFVQGELTYYNHKLDNKDHHLASFVRLEMQF